jgi:hypothetical protein
MRQFAASTTISACPETIWTLLTDAGGYSQWNSTIERIEGRIAAGGKVIVYAKVAPGRAFSLRVTEFVPPRRMVWTGGLPLGLFTGTRGYTLNPVSDTEVEFTMREEYNGLLARLITRLLPDLQPSFDTFAADLKRRAESIASAEENSARATLASMP